jgi:hypothetical protein
MENFLLKLIYGYEQFGDEIGFSKEEIDNLVKENLDIDELKCNERGLIVLWKNGYLSNEKFGKFMGLEYEDKDFWLVESSFCDILNEPICEILDGDYDWNYDVYSDYSTNDIQNYYWRDYTVETLKDIIDFCIRRKLEINVEEITKSNTIIKDNDIYFNDKKFVNYLKEDDLEELGDVLKFSIGEAQYVAEIDGYTKEIKDNFIEKVGEYKWKTVTNQKGKTEGKLYIKMDVDWDEIEKNLKDWYGDFEFEDGEFGSLYHILREMDVFDIEIPDDRYNNYDFDDKLLNEITSNRLQWD